MTGNTRRVSGLFVRALGAFAALLSLLGPAAAFAGEALPAQEEVPGGTLMLVAYVLVWILPLFLLWRTSRRIGGIERDVRDLSRMIRRAEEDAP